MTATDAVHTADFSTENGTAAMGFTTAKTRILLRLRKLRDEIARSGWGFWPIRSAQLAAIQEAIELVEGVRLGEGGVDVTTNDADGVALCASCEQLISEVDDTYNERHCPHGGPA